MNFLTRERLTYIAIIILVVLNIVTLFLLWNTRLQRPVDDFDRMHPPHKRMKKASEYIMQQYHLKEEQIDRFFEIKDQHFNHSTTKREEIKSLRDEIYQELFKENPDTAKVNKIIDQIGGKYAEIIQMNFYHFLELKSIFPDDQQEKYQRFIEDIIDRMDHFRHGQPGEKKRGHMRNPNQ